GVVGGVGGGRGGGRVGGRRPGRRHGGQPAPGRLVEPAADERVALPPLPPERRVSARARIAIGALAAAIVLAGLGALGLALLLREPVVATRATKDVPATWRGVRDSFGHVTHVVYGDVPCRDCHKDGYD